MSLLDEFKWLFTDSDTDIRGNLAAKVLIDKSESKNWLNAVNYEDSSKQGERDDDVHHEITQFVVDTALFHKLLDDSQSLDVNKKQQKVYEKVYARWNSLSDNAKAFYTKYMDLLKKDQTGTWVKADESDYSRAGSDKTNFRLNLKKDTKNGKVLLGLNLPLILLNQSRNIWYEDNTNVLRSAPAAGNQNFLRDTYNNILTRPINALNVNTTRSTQTHFSINTDKLVTRRLFGISEADVVEGELELTDDDALVNLVGRDVVKRDTNGLYVDMNGTKAYLNATDAETRNRLQSAHNCYGTGVNKGNNTNGNVECKRFIFECLLSQDASSLDTCLRDLMTQKDFFKVAVEDIKNIHPVLALRILQQFGFRKYQVHDSTAGMQLWKVESVNHWLENYMTKKFTSQDVSDMIKQNDQYHLLSYLKLVSQYVNANPAILNKHYSGTSDEAVGRLEISALGKALGLSFEVPRDPANRTRADYARLSSNLRLMRTSRMPVFVAGTGRRFLTTPWGSSMTPGVSMLVQRGGGNCNQKDIHIQGQLGATQLEGFVNLALKNLERHGKKLNQKDEERIRMWVQKSREIEKELIRTLCYLDEYNSLLDVLGDYSSARLSQANLQRIVDRQNVLLGKQGSTDEQVMNMLSKLVDLVDDEAVAPMAQVKASDALAN
ncbi:hypothetical protein Indivirus_1_4 [Indivirus ILV1]|uniref:Uncharacterized protein n=1 Tax=Indivirus ILV1 TaxID=1977633 RepID=A0A1V0SCG4_9VIRU|nr:hypothetical protein Indivirus_1_4 [Indivirus ILV1]